DVALAAPVFADDKELVAPGGNPATDPSHVSESSGVGPRYCRSTPLLPLCQLNEFDALRPLRVKCLQHSLWWRGLLSEARDLRRPGRGALTDQRDRCGRHDAIEEKSPLLEEDNRLHMCLLEQELLDLRAVVDVQPIRRCDECDACLIGCELDRADEE